MSKRWWMMAGLLLIVATVMLQRSGAQAPGGTDVAGPAAPAGELALPAAGGAPAAEDNRPPPDSSFLSVVISSGFIGVLIWLGLLGSSIAATALSVDGLIRIREEKISPPALIAKVRQAMTTGDLALAMRSCAEHPSPFANILATGFNNIREGFEIIQDAVGVAADIETERLMQRVLYINVQVAVAPMLGLLGTVQGMILAFHSLATMQAGAAQQAMLALNISQALWTTAAGLIIALPALTVFTMLKNKAAKIILNMEAMTLEMTKGLKNVEVVEE